MRRFMLCALLGWAGALAAQASPRAPTAGWVVDFHASQCVAYRQYGSEAEPLILLLKSPPLGDVMQLSVIRKGDASEPTQVRAEIGADALSPVAANMLIFGSGDGKLRVYQVNLSPAQFALVKEARTLTVKAKGLDESFALSQMDELLPVIDKCVADLRRVWNVKDTSGETSYLRARAKGNLADIIRDWEYPDVALYSDQTGVVSFVLLVDEKGAVADCTVTGTSGVPSLDAQTCAILRARARFTPAMGADGRPAKDAVTSRISWKIRR